MNLDIILAFSAGLLSFLSPCVLPLIPAYLGYLAGSAVSEINTPKARANLVLRSVCFVVGFSAVFILLAVTVGSVGRLLSVRLGVLRKAGGILVFGWGLPPLNLIDAGARQKAPDFTLTDLTGKSVSLKALKGKDVYINFWATWCPWCKEELPDLEKVSQEYRDKDLVVLAVDIGEDKTTVGNYIKQNHYDFNALPDTDKKVAQQYRVSSIPVSVFIDRNGNIAQWHIGALTGDQMKSLVDQLGREQQSLFSIRK